MHILKQSQYLRHEQYGLGVVTQSTAERTTIDFNDFGVKKFVTSLLVVELLPGPAPARSAVPKTRRKASGSAEARPKSKA